MDKRQRAQTEIQEIFFKHMEKKITVRVTEHWNRDGTVSILAGIQNPTGQSPGQAAVAETALSRWVGLDHLWRSFPNSTITWFCEWLQPFLTFFLWARGCEKNRGEKKNKQTFILHNVSIFFLTLSWQNAYQQVCSVSICLFVVRLALLVTSLH